MIINNVIDALPGLRGFENRAKAVRRLLAGVDDTIVGSWAGLAQHVR